MSRKRMLQYPVSKITLTLPTKREYKIMDQTCKRLNMTHAAWLRSLILTYGDRHIPDEEGAL